jgi:hypothetical protein
MNRVGRVIARSLLSFIWIGAAVPAFAQAGGAVSTRPIDLAVGYQFTHTPDVNLPLGFGVDVAAPIADTLSVVGEFSWARRMVDEISGFNVSVSQTLTTFGGGVRWNPPSSDVKPYVQVIAGAARAAVGDLTFAGVTVAATSETKFMLQPGVGVSAGVATGLRGFGEVDFRRIFADTGENEVRVLVGVVFGFGR